MPLCSDILGRMKILVLSSSRHGSTEEIADVVAEELVKAGLEVDRRHPEDVESLDGYAAVVIGSAVYMTSWTAETVAFTKRVTSQLEKLPVFAFSVGLSGLPKGKVSDPYRVGPALLSIDPEDHVTFAGRLDPSHLTLRERTIVKLGGVSEGDYRDWDEIRSWAGSVAATLI